MPTIRELLNSQGEVWGGTSGDFYFPKNQNPHLHLRVDNGTAEVKQLSDIQKHIVFFQITNLPSDFNRGKAVIDITNTTTENKDLITKALRKFWDTETADQVHRYINFIAQIGVDR
jgi:hypothetical protein